MTNLSASNFVHSEGLTKTRCKKNEHETTRKESRSSTSLIYRASNFFYCIIANFRFIAAHTNISRMVKKDCSSIKNTWFLRKIKTFVVLLPVCMRRREKNSSAFWNFKVFFAVCVFFAPIYWHTLSSTSSSFHPSLHFGISLLYML